MMFEALDRVMKAKGRLGYLRDLFYSHQKAETFSFAPMRFPYLNRTQEEAVNKVLWAKDVAVVHGPPGTGKTTTSSRPSMKPYGGRVRCWSVRRVTWLSTGYPRSLSTVESTY